MVAVAMSLGTGTEYFAIAHCRMRIDADNFKPVVR